MRGDDCKKGLIRLCCCYACVLPDIVKVSRDWEYCLYKILEQLSILKITPKLYRQVHQPFIFFTALKAIASIWNSSFTLCISPSSCKVCVKHHLLSNIWLIIIFSVPHLPLMDLSIKSIKHSVHDHQRVPDHCQWIRCCDGSMREYHHHQCDWEYQSTLWHAALHQKMVSFFDNSKENIFCCWATR